ncbi:unnamed protein product [Polarella glacialis]|uniref:Uncharacterized protein n=1 Tax=Polarella glacialis TaxID=89957 RepID=A0A813KLI7_POLGL|nr:unnamed protein product [Polarella glacialis]
MDLRRWRLHLLVLTTGVFGICEASSTPAAPGWRIAARKTLRNWKWDVHKLNFNTAAGPLSIGGPQDCVPINDSGSVSDPLFGGIPGYGSWQIFPNNSTSRIRRGYWSGRSNGSLFFVGLQCLTPVIVHSVEITQGNQVGENWFAQIYVQALVDNSWTTLFEAQVPPARGLRSGFQTVFNDMSMSEPPWICGEACKNKGFCCNDPLVGSNQMISCSQACFMKAGGLAAPSCSKLCARNTSSGCDLTVEGNNYSFCSSCADLTNSSKCTYGVASPEACLAGCELSPPTVAVGARPVVAGARRTKLGVDKTLIAALTVGILACTASIGVIVACRYRRRKGSDPHAESRDAAQENSQAPCQASCCSSQALPSQLLRAALPSQLFKSAERRRDLDPCWAAISVAQLGELRQLAMAALGTEYWTATMHDINRVVLQPLCQRTGKCYAHVVNCEELLHITVFVSHAWLENFEQFFQSINSAFQNWTVKPNLWICATALLQSTDPATVSLQIGAGVSPSEAPFTKALAKAEKLLIVRNATVDLYERIWCCWEFFLAYQQGMIHRPGAVIVVGPSMFGTGTKEVDVTSALSSNIEDKRKILEHISKTASYQVINDKLTEIKFFNGRKEGTVDVEANSAQ